MHIQNGIKKMREVEIVVRDEPSVPEAIRGMTVRAAVVPSAGRQTFTFNSCGAQWVADSSVVDVVANSVDEEEREVE